MTTKHFGDFTEEAADNENTPGSVETAAPDAVAGAGPDPAADEYTTAVDSTLDAMRDSNAPDAGAVRVPGDAHDAGADGAPGDRVQAEARSRNRTEDGEALARSFLEMLERAADGKLTNADGKASQEQKDAFCKAAGRVIEKRVGAAIPWEDELVLIGTGLVVLIDPLKKLFDRLKQRRGAA